VPQHEPNENRFYMLQRTGLTCDRQKEGDFPDRQAPVDFEKGGIVKSRRLCSLLIWSFLLGVTPWGWGQARRQTATYRQLKAYLDSVPAIDTHDHLQPFDQLPGYVQTEWGRGMNLFGVLHSAYYPWINPLTGWEPGETFDKWWAEARHSFDDARATNLYQYLLPAFQDLYGVDFNHITDAQARGLDRRIFENYKDQRWLSEVITKRANIELMFIDPYWARLDFRTDYPFAVLVFNVTSLVWGFHSSEYQPRYHPMYFGVFDDPYLFASQRGLPANSLDDYLALLDHIFAEAKAHGAVCLKSTLAYERTLQFENVPRERAARVFGRPRSDLNPEEVKAFEDFIMWRLAELSAKYDLPFQIHTGVARLRDSNPMLLLDLIEGNPHTKFILFHGGFPWVDETGAIVFSEMGGAKNVWIDSVFLPIQSSTMAERAYHEWLDVMPSDRIMWGSDDRTAEGIYGATEFTRRCLAGVLAEKVDNGDISDEVARGIGKQIVRDNALKLFPQLKARLKTDGGRH